MFQQDHIQSMNILEAQNSSALKRSSLIAENQFSKNYGQEQTSRDNTVLVL